MDALESHARDETISPPPETTAREQAMLRYALALTRAPATMTRDDLEPLRTAGLDGREILEANQVAAYFAYVNRLVDGLGIELEPYRSTHDD